jgi:SpoVK/Ycf46/Vps4 family AAA+-type ATPase
MTSLQSKDTPLSVQEEAFLYETALFDYRKILQTTTTSPNDTATTKEDRFCQQFTARVNLLCAVHNNPVFRERTVQDLEEESDSYAQLIESIFVQKSRHRRNQPQQLTPVSVNVDGFFEMYPECMRKFGDDDDESSEDEVEEITEQPEVVVMETSKAKRIAIDKPYPSVNNYHQKPANNPYASRQHTESHPQVTNPSLPFIEHSVSHQQRPGSWQDPTTKTNGTSSSIHNPFQTARDVSLAPEPSSKASTHHLPQHANNNINPPIHSLPEHANVNHHRTHNPYTPHNNFQSTATSWDQPSHAPPANFPPGGYNPYQHNCPSLSSPPPPPPMEIRDSLKRKFVPPVKRGLAKTVPSVSDGAAAAKTSQNNKPDSESDDDLPEELKRFGKELVEKIESEIMDRGDPVTFDDIAGLLDAKQTVQEVVCWPMKRPDLFTGLRRAPNGLLLYGPPGTGKTLIGKAIAHESGATFFSISSSSLTSKWIGEGEKLVRTLFAVAGVREPSVVFIDEIDSLLTQRKSDENEASRRIKTEFLVQLDGTGTSGRGRVLIIGATNRPQELDEAARRRFTKRLYIPLPNEDDRERLLRVLLDNNKHSLVDSEIVKLAKDTDGFSGADLKALSTDAAMGPIRELGSRALDVNIDDIPPIAYKHFRQALRGIKPSVAPSDLIQYEEWDKTYGSNRSHGEEGDAKESDDEQ